MDFLSKYPLTKKMMKKTGMSLEQIYEWSERELERLKI